MESNPFAAAADNPFAVSEDTQGQGQDEEGYTPPTLTPRSTTNPFSLDGENDATTTSVQGAGAYADASTRNPFAAQDTRTSFAAREELPPVDEAVPRAPEFMPPWMQTSADGGGGTATTTTTRNGGGAAAKPEKFVSGPPAASGGGIGGEARETTFNAARLAELEAREADIARRERELASRQAELGDAINATRKNNYPPCLPLTRAKINEDILVQNRHMVRLGFIAWHLTELGYIFNWVAVVVLWQTNKAKSTTNFFMASLVATAGIPFSFMFWWQALYKAGEVNTSFSYIRFFWHFAFHTFWAFWMAIAIPVVGSFSAGLVDFILNLIQGKLTNAILCIVNVAIWATVAVLSLTIFRLAYQRWRGQGGQEQLQTQANTARMLFGGLFSGTRSGTQQPVPGGTAPPAI